MKKVAFQIDETRWGISVSGLDNWTAIWKKVKMYH